MPITKIISGGQTGADQAGLYAARDLGLLTGGYMPKGFRTEIGPWHEAQAFAMRETNTADYKPRTMLNIEESDGTILFGRQSSQGSTLTRHYCMARSKPLWQVPWKRTDLSVAIPLGIMHWLKFHNVKTLNVAGNREGVNPGIFAACRDFIMALTEEYNQL